MFSSISSRYESDESSWSAPSPASSSFFSVTAPFNTDKDADDPDFIPEHHQARSADQPSGDTDDASRASRMDLTADDLPIIPVGNHNPYLQLYPDLPVLQKLDWQTDDDGRPVLRSLCTITLRAAFMQTWGIQAQTPCTWPPKAYAPTVALLRIGDVLTFKDNH
ncbi:hypothetical protein BJX64DRAFT_283240 [Aspergillus heterothallicus]